ncbi:hypothetical protein ASPVEDRAFT_35148 [Aspergillus versicolor CBS 583.65]|uniref:Rhodopsin domain-containing protein n=1 Tax=Aspergillus versicolor CBS 583.65 TaxID=1036611 RepID=A0A1L9P2S0_ASPVE|nr:uncharacterized protein ASPVEDRAFT_35148 [Aspergillus versicolor CBS 583.65]OJI95839.1 hypothetical protein ASPVEDRAFT_35148 [Aspergillus versicolor CBS 583.65]
MNMESGTDRNSISQEALYATIWVEYGICTVVMLLRAYSQFFVLRKFTIDDFVMLGAYVCQGVASALCTASTHYGLGASVMSLSYSKIVNVLKFVMISMPFGVLAPLFGRISFILFLLSSVITVHNPRRKWLWVLVGLQLVINIIPCILQFTQCQPASALWDPLSLIQKCQGAVVVQKYGYFQGAFNALTDLILTVIGLVVILSLKTHRSNKIALCSILSLSLLAMIAAILKTVQIRIMNTFEFSQAMGLWAIWFLTEGTVVIVTASVPRLRAIVVLGRQPKSSYTPYNTATPRGRSNNINNSAENGSYTTKDQSVRNKYIDTPIDETALFEERGRSEDIPDDFETLPMESATELIPVRGRSAV